MLLGDFFTVDFKEATDNSLVANISINPAHRIFDGHFPGQPVVPGVCMLQIIKELVESSIHKKLQLKKASHLKFLAIINPRENPVISVEFSFEAGTNEININGRLFMKTITFFKFKGIFIFENTNNNAINLTVP